MSVQNREVECVEVLDNGWLDFHANARITVWPVRAAMARLGRAYSPVVAGGTAIWHHPTKQSEIPAYESGNFDPPADPRSPHQQRVEQFMAKAERELPARPTMPSVEVRRLRARLIWEEALETIEALGFQFDVAYHQDLATGRTTPVLIGIRDHEPDLERIVDGCADLSVVTIGTLSACGVADTPVLEEVDAANLRKFEPPKCDSCGGEMIFIPGVHSDCNAARGGSWRCRQDRCRLMTKTASQGPYKDANGKWIKPPYFKGPDIKKVLDSLK